MSLQDEIASELSWIAAGAPSDRLLDEARLAVRTILARHGLARARVHVTLQQGVLSVDVDPPPELPRVQRIRLRLGS